MTPTPSPSQTETQIEREQRVAYEAAEQAYRLSLRDFEVALNNGGSRTLPPSVDRYVSGSYQSELASFLKGIADDGFSGRGFTKITKIIRAGYEPSELLLFVCVDGSGTVILNKAGKTDSRGESAVYDVTAKSNSTGWTIDTAKTRKSAACPG